MKKSMKRSSISMFVAVFSIVCMSACSTVAQAQTKKSKFVYDQKENVETVFELDQTKRFLTPVLKYELTKNEKGMTVEKKAYRWDAQQATWNPYYILTFTTEGSNSVLHYAMWNKATADFSLNQQKAVYNKNTENDMISYISYHWNDSVNDWNLKEQALFQNYLAIHVTD